MNRYNHCDRETVSPTNLCIDCLQKGHVSGRCEACRVEAWETILRIERLPSDNIETRSTNLSVESPQTTALHVPRASQ